MLTRNHMKIFLNILLLLLFWNTAAIGQTRNHPVAVEPGVSLELALSRSASISNLQYHLNFLIPASKNSAIHATEKIEFKLSSVPDILQLDFKQSADHIKHIKVNGDSIAIQLTKEHLLVDAKYLDTGSNQIEIQFIAGNESLNRNNDYLYALFVPDRARSAFPCFDQPDLKANFHLTLTVPATWKVLANGSKLDYLAAGQ